MMKEIEKLRSGEYYRMDDAEIAEIQTRAIVLCQQFNSLPVTAGEERDKLLRRLFSSAGQNLSVKPGFLCDLGVNIQVGRRFPDQLQRDHPRHGARPHRQQRVARSECGSVCRGASDGSGRQGTAAGHRQADNHRRQRLDRWELGRADGRDYRA